MGWVLKITPLYCVEAEKAMAPYSTILTWKISWMKEPSRLQSMGSLRVGHGWETSLSLFTFMYWRRKWHITPVFLPGESQERGRGAEGKPGELLSIGSLRVEQNWSDLAAAALCGAHCLYYIWRHLLPKTFYYSNPLSRLFVSLCIGWKFSHLFLVS